MSDFKELQVWKCAMNLVISVYDLLNHLPTNEKYALGDQMRRAAVSIPSNIAEGQARGSKKEFRHFLNIAFGSLAELETQLYICERVGYLNNDQLSTTFELVDRVQKMIYRLIQSLTSSTTSNV